MRRRSGRKRAPEKERAMVSLDQVCHRRQEQHPQCGGVITKVSTRLCPKMLD